jgi:hypothetical protein
MPRVVFVDSSGGETEIPAGGVTSPDRTGTALDAVVPQGLLGPTDATAAAVVYDLNIINANGNSGSLVGALTVVPPPDLIGVQPAQGAAGTLVSVTLTGAGFRDGLTVTLDANPAVSGTNVVVADSGSATADFDLNGVAPGTYDITLTNSEGCSSTLPNAFTVTNPTFFALTGIDPPFGCTCSDTTVTITSAGGFVSTPTVQMRPTGQTSPVINFERVAFIDSSTLTAVVPGGADLGDYDVSVINPPSDGTIGVLEAGFRVVALPIPTIEAITPSRGDPGADTPVTVFGENFRDTVTLELLDDTLAVAATVANITPISANELQTTFPTNNMAEGIYLVRVTNNDEMTYSTFSNFLVAASGASGNLHPFSQQSVLNTGRRLLAGTQARDDNGNFYLYAAGGDTGDGGTVLDSVEVTQLSKFGELGTWEESRNLLNTARVGASLVSVPVFDPAGSAFIPSISYLYVLGGQDDQGNGTILSSIERAVVLSTDDAPVLDGAVGAGAGTLDAGTWYYKVSAVLDGADPDNPGGETLPSDEAIVTIGATGSVDLSWPEVMVNGAAAVSYRIYRTAAVDGASQTELLIDTVTGTSYSDVGATAGTDAPLPSGSTGVWGGLAEAMTTPRWGHSAAVVTESDGVTRSIAIVAGKSDATTSYLASVEFAAIDNLDGSISAPSGANTNDLPTARAFFSLALETSESVSGYAGGTRLWVIGGVSAGASVFDAQTTEVTTGGGNDAFVVPTTSNGQPANGQPIAGSHAVIVGDKLFVMGGASVANDTSFSNLVATARDAALTGVVGGDGQFGSPYNSASQSFVGGARALGSSIIGSGFIYFVGGSSDGTDALATCEKTF